VGDVVMIHSVVCLLRHAAVAKCPDEREVREEDG